MRKIHKRKIEECVRRLLTILHYLGREALVLTILEFSLNC